MIQALRSFFDSLNGDQEPTAPNASIELCCFSLMVTIAKIDQRFDSSERNAIVSLGRSNFKLSEDTVSAVLKDAECAADLSTSLYEFTDVIREKLDEQSKFNLVKCLWIVAYADGQIDKYEEHIIRKVADLIYLDHARFTEAKLQAQSG